MKKNIHLSVLLIVLLIVSCKQDVKKVVVEEKATETSAEPDKKKPLSPHTSTMAMIGDAHIHIDYSSPGVRNRIIFGGLLAYDQLWQAGAHMATWIETNKDLIIDGKMLPAGKYGFFTIPSKEEWTIIFNSNWDQHGKDEYEEKDDVLRFKVKPIISDEVTEHLEYQVNKINDNEGAISLSWEKVSIKFNFKVNQ
ncbi:MULTISPECIES: DUF2911 domain-containing protein [Flagellimonas]|uniref:DUF2911 domain-containing protein n=1 Tax=Flagellimonas abyssi TaxID=2864871 RepID=A0ABS7EV65_9FLAO|nr:MULTISPECIES: DUF2911 domain-containing protein [Allomuricauda]MBA4744456.1 DUF2911 domain-containing protein [Allomuricauda sp.]MBW8201501.1 DUF2911 domain-containing protein [Allomuricauda abyssi]MCR9228928.1 DUF2911 domain-containing protein [Flavobacteriaceae bacterium]|tara:strand:+ start:61 stop:645 length:585 start_codon:yes stop_codon:yes gene_type:complete